MPVQTEYEAVHGAGYEGQKVDFQICNITSKVVETAAGIAFGRAVVRGVGDDSCKIPSAAGQGFVGITEMTTDGVEDASGLHQYEHKREANILDLGILYGYTEVAVVPGDPVFYRVTATVAPRDIMGRFRNTDDASRAEAIPGATFESTTAAGQLAKIKLTGQK